MSDRIRMIEAFDGKIRHLYDDGLYVHTGDLLEILEKDFEVYQSMTDFSGAEVIEGLISRVQTMILNRTGGK